MFSASPEWTDRDCSIPEYKKTVTSVHTRKHTRLHRDGGAGSGGQIHYNNPRGCHGPDHSVEANRGQRWTEHGKLSKKKTPEDSPRSEMCLCLHSNTPTAAATRGTRSNKAVREGRGEEVVSSTLSTKGKSERKRKEREKHDFFQERC